MPRIMVTSGAQDTSLDGKGMPRVVAVGCGLWLGPAVNRGWHLLSQAQES